MLTSITPTQTGS